VLHLLVFPQFRTQNRCTLLLELLVSSQFRTQNRCTLLLELLLAADAFASRQ
jgi:hypothetical protein